LNDFLSLTRGELWRSLGHTPTFDSQITALDGRRIKSDNRPRLE
jgi:hypothetical protein